MESATIFSPLGKAYGAFCYPSEPNIPERPEYEKISTLYEPQHEISNFVICATSKASDQPAHTRSLI